jgi:hypothetical protein
VLYVNHNEKENSHGVDESPDDSNARPLWEA